MPDRFPGPRRFSRGATLANLVILLALAAAWALVLLLGLLVWGFFTGRI